MRGISNRVLVARHKLRFNPAYAGNIFERFMKNENTKVQPRVCGEYQSLLATNFIASGSTPRMRGISPICYAPIFGCRFNPAYAGNILSLKESKTEVQVQPRVCGEYTLLHCQQFFLAGSTPRMRGIFMQTREKRFAWRFNPAYAGNIAFFQSRKAVYQVQPRVCGEYLLPTPSPDLLLGSTPRMRGI